jgi:hypothetical protein
MIKKPDDITKRAEWVAPMATVPDLADLPGLPTSKPISSLSLDD